MSIRLALWLLLAWPWLTHASPEYWLETRLEPGNEVTVGSTATLEIDVLVDTWFVEPPRFEAWTLEGARITFDGSQGRNLHRSRDGKPYYGLTFSYQIVPTRAGEFQIPSLTLNLKAGRAEGSTSLQTEPVRFESKLPAALAGRGPTLMASSVEAIQSVLPEPSRLAVGAVLTREVTLKAMGARTITFPAPAIPDPNGAKGERKPPVITDLTNERGQAVGAQRIDAITYVAESPGKLTLPSFSVTWWDTTTGKLTETLIPATEVMVQPSPRASSPFATESKLATLQRRVDGQLPAWLWSAVALALVWCARKPLLQGFRKLHRCLQKMKARWQSSRLHLRYRAQRLLNNNPPDLIGLYRLQARNRRSERLLPDIDQDLAPRKREEIKRGLSECFGENPAPARGQRRLRRVIGALAKRPGPLRGKPQRRVLPPLNEAD
ncbi:BatD family protein [Marinobacter sp. F4216]|uniref:BatD family protein n=1 Tax=Marinobacter sp. F4216 TaxID=2874281 RepID=UPI001CBC0C87|nr:BatD family protein [Marinobacter sp. F4216]MBZ2169825.1 BatD family protein [Marinobacter sp. F4216]